MKAALDLEKKLGKEAEITLVDKSSYHLFIPALYEVASVYGIERDPFAVKISKTICIPFVDIFENKKINFVQAEIIEIDLTNKKIRTRGGHELSCDYMILALGSQTTDFGIPGVIEYAYQFKSLNDALMINEKVNSLHREAGQGKKELPIRILVIGAGFTGIELAAELSSCVKTLAHKCDLRHGCTMITIFEAGPKILSAISDKERQIISERLTRLGVIIMENSPIEEVAANSVKMKDGRALSGDMIIWTAGITANKILENTHGLNLNKGRIVVDDNLAVIGYKNIYAIGDNTEFIDKNIHKPLPSMAYIAQGEGITAAKNIYNTINGAPPKAYGIPPSIWIAPAGGKFALAHLWWGMSIKGFWGWVMRELVDLRYMLSILPLKKAIKIFWEETAIFTKND